MNLQISESDALRLVLETERITRSDAQLQSLQLQGQAVIDAKARAEKSRAELLERLGLAGREISVIFEPGSQFPIGTVLDARTGQPLPAPEAPKVETATAIAEKAIGIAQEAIALTKGANDRMTDLISNPPA